jgi:poly-beta-1,6-N-acetyl-D-glucosamine synthase
MRASPPTDAVTGLPTREQLHVDLRLLREGAQQGTQQGTRLLATLTLDGLQACERDRGRDRADELLRTLAQRLLDALGGGGSAYSLARGRFALLLQSGRASGEAILRAATAALHEDREGLQIVASCESVTIASRSVDPAAVLRRLEASGCSRAQTPPPEAAKAAIAAPPREPEVARSPSNASGAQTREAAAGSNGASRSVAAATLLPPASPRSSRLPTAGTATALAPAPTLPPAPPAPLVEEPRAPRAADAIEAARRRDRQPSNPPPRRMPYLTVRVRFAISVVLGVLWVGLSSWIASPWIAELSRSISLPGAIFVIAGIALVPGYLNVQLVSSLLLDHPAPIDFDFSYPGLTVLVAAYEEERDIARTLAYALDQDYPGELRVILADDGSSDATASIGRGLARADMRLRVVEVPHGGKANALNAALTQAQTPLVATIDADTLLMPNALRRIVARMLLCPEGTVAVAGSVLARNSRAGLLTRMQTWDYFLGIGSIKRQQALLQSTLVAQGAFSVYDRAALMQAGGWPDCIGEDIVLTWALIAGGGGTSYEPSAVAFTEVPETLRHLARQRRRWARGMIEGLRSYGLALLRQRQPYGHSVAANVLFPYLDAIFTFAFLPGIVLAAFGDFAIVGPMTLAVLPLNALLSAIMYLRQRRSLSQAGLSMRRHTLGYVAYLLVYQIIMSPVSVIGYLEEALHAGRKW